MTAQTETYPHFTSDPVPVLHSRDGREPARSPVANPYQIGARALGDRPEFAYLFFGGPVRPATDEENAVYAARADDPKWADIYRPTAADATDAGDDDPAAAPDDPDTGAGD